MGAMVPPSRKSCYNFRVTEIVKVLDGDTIDVLIDLGFDLFKKERVRIAGVDTPEKRTRDLEEKERGLKAKDRLINILKENEDSVVLKSHGIGKFGRCLGELIAYKLFENSLLPMSINQQLVDEGHAVEYFGGKR